MVQRLIYRSRYATRLIKHRIVKTPGELVYRTVTRRGQYRRPATSRGKFPVKPYECKSRSSRNRITVNRAYGGVLSSSEVRERIIRAFLVEERKIVKKVQKAKEKVAPKA